MPVWMPPIASTWQAPSPRHRAEGGIAVIATHGDIEVRAPHVLELAA